MKLRNCLEHWKRLQLDIKMKLLAYRRSAYSQIIIQPSIIGTTINYLVYGQIDKLNFMYIKKIRNKKRDAATKSHMGRDG